MNMIFKIGALGLFLVFFGCSKNEPIEEGVYSGIFTVKYNVEMSKSWGSGNGITTLELKNWRYMCTGNPDRIPAGGQGSYSISKSRIVFNEEHLWLANFDWGLILHGEYNYKFDGNRLKITKKTENALYEYDLIKQ